MILRVVTFIAGALLALWTLGSALRTVVLPRSARPLLDRMAFLAARLVFRAVAGLRGSYRWRDRVYALYAPVGLVVVVGTWLVSLTLAFTIVFWSVEQLGWADAFHKSGSSLLTLGFASVEGTGLRVVAFVEAALGLGVLALLIAYLPALYGAFSQRERRVALLEVRAGSPPWGVTMLERIHRIGWADHLPGLWADWERWFVEMEESHGAFPVLVFYRSTHADRHWVIAAGAVLDAAALSVSACSFGDQPHASLLLRAGSMSLHRIAGFFGVEQQGSGAGDQISIARSEFDEAYRRLAAAGAPMAGDADAAWEEFVARRASYDGVLLTLAEITTAPYAPWTSDRSALGYRRPSLRRWGLRRGR